MRFEFSTAGRIVFGAGALQEAGEIVGGMGGRPLVVTGRTTGRAEPLLSLLAGRGLTSTTYAVAGEPDVDSVRRGAALARDEGCDCVVGFGGGAALDAAKAIAILMTNPGDVLDYLEIVGRGKTLTEAPLPMMAIPTTAGTGTEVTRNSVIISPEHRVKVSLRSPLMLPGIALVDPELTYTLPPTLTATTGLDALTQLIEPFVCTRANPFTDGLCKEGITRVVRSLRRVVDSGQTVAARGSAGAPEIAAAREDMAVASLFGGLALANAGLGAVHGIAGPLGGMARGASRSRLRGAPAGSGRGQPLCPAPARAQKRSPGPLRQARPTPHRRLGRGRRRSLQVAAPIGRRPGDPGTRRLRGRTRAYPRVGGEGRVRQQYEGQPGRADPRGVGVDSRVRALGQRAGPLR